MIISGIRIVGQHIVFSCLEVLPGYRAEPLSLSLVYPQRRELSRRVNLFMQWLAGVMKEHLD
jgi:DNA-binding transcriptional LysR family regulator